MKKLLSLILALLMCFALLPSVVAESEENTVDQISGDQSENIDGTGNVECDHDCDSCDHCYYDDCEGCDDETDEILISEDESYEMLTDLDSIESYGNDSNEQTEGDSKALKYHYDPDLAIAQAGALLDDVSYNFPPSQDYSNCARFVSTVLRAGGLTNVKQEGAGSLINYLKSSSNFGGSIGKVVLNPTGNQLNKGDVLCVVCYHGGNATDYTGGHTAGSGNYWGLHVVIVSNVISNEKVKYYAATTNVYGNKELTLSTYANSFNCKSHHSHQYIKLIAFCFNDEVKTHNSCDLYAYKNYSGKNYLYGSDFTSLDSYYWSSRDTSVSTISIDSSNRHNGYNSLKIVNASAGSSNKDLQIRTMVNSDVGSHGFAGSKSGKKDMILSFWAKSSKAGTKMYFRWGREKDSAYRSVTLTTDWAKYTVRMDKQTYFNAGIYPYVNAAGTVWLSEMQLEDGATATDFVPENGGLYAAVPSLYGGKYTMPVTPSRSGYIFDGWYTEANGGTEITLSTAVKGGHYCVYARWTKNAANTVVVTFDPNGGNVSPASKSVTFGGTYGTLPTPTLTNYTFDGWYTAPNGGSKVTSSTTVTTASDHRLYAHWVGNSITVTFDANGGFCSYANSSVLYGAAYGTLPTPTWSGHSFVGWYTDRNAGMLITASTIVSVAYDHTLYAHWDDNRYLEINDSNFPDPAFRQWIIDNLPISGSSSDGYYMTEAQVTGVTAIDCSGRGIQSLQGIAFFTNLHTLNCGYNYENNTANSITDLDVSSNTWLEDLDCRNNALSSLDVGNNVNLRNLSCSGNQLTALDVSRNYALEWLDCEENQLTSLFLDNNRSLVFLACGQNRLTSLDLSMNTALTRLYCGANALIGLDLRNNTALDYVYCPDNRLFELHISPNDSLWGLMCYGNYLTALDVSNCTALRELTCKKNYLTSLNVSNDTALQTLECGDNQLTTLDLGDLNALSYLEAHQTVEGHEGVFREGIFTYDLSKIVPMNQMGNVYPTTGVLAVDTGILSLPSEVESFTYNFDTGKGNMDVEVYITFDMPTITVTFDPTGGSVSPTSKTSAYGHEYGELPVPTRTGFTFWYWAPSPSGGHPINEDTVITSTSDHTVYAMWEPNTYVVHFDANGGTCSTSQSWVIYSDTYGDLPTPTWEDHTFLGWFTAASGGSQVTSSTTVTTASNHTLYAHWTLEAKPAFKTQALTLEGKIGVSFFVDLPQIDGIVYEGVNFTIDSIDGADAFVPFSGEGHPTNNSGYYQFTYYVRTIEMANTITATLRYKLNGEDQTLEKTYSVKQYFEAIEPN
ncbi:MAG: InlB B-repeat-containing protein, partial [Clostridia bacterium]|nr:InlB B-repeat-containing protein [Clostridia bacterium]